MGDNSMPEKQFDVVVVGAGFSGIYHLYHLRKAGFSVRAFEKGSDLGGTWYWNTYPGARVDSTAPFYQLSDPGLWGVSSDNAANWTFSERFPGWQELQSYFAFVESKWDLKRDITFDTEVIGAQYDEESHMWNVQCDDGTTTRCRWLILAIGFASQRYVPPWEGLDTFKGTWYHTGVWPRSNIDFKGKKVAVIGTGASGVQVIQEIASDVAKLTVYQRTPNFAIPMVQRPLITEEEIPKKVSSDYADAFASRRITFHGFDARDLGRKLADDSPEQRQEVFERLYGKGGFSFLIESYSDIGGNQDANDAVYRFWAEKTRARIDDPQNKDLLAPLKAPHPFGAKRPSLEQHYYEVFNQPNVDIVDVSSEPILGITEKGVMTKGGVVEVDIIVVATGYDAVSGSLTRIDLKGIDGLNLRERWKDGVSSFLGMAIAGYPNMFYTYGVQAPTAFSNGPSCIEIQGDWIIQTLRDMREAGVTRLEATEEAQREYSNESDQIWNQSLSAGTKGWYQGGNIPGKPMQGLNWAGGIPEYISKITHCQDNEYEGFTQQKAHEPAFDTQTSSRL